MPPGNFGNGLPGTGGMAEAGYRAVKWMARRLLPPRVRTWLVNSRA